MISIKEAMQKIANDGELKKQFMAVAESGREETMAFLQSLDCDATYEELMESFNETAEESDRELTKEELEFVAGGSKAGAKKFLECVDSFFSGWADV